MRYIVILGATGSIGKTAIKIIEEHPSEFELVGFSGYSQREKILDLARRFPRALISVANLEDKNWLKSYLEHRTIYYGMEGLKELSTLKNADIILLAIVGTAAFLSAFHAIEEGKDLAIASKEILVMGGQKIIDSAKKFGSKILPVDSEHSAIFQCLEGRDQSTIRQIFLTCSGGPFLHFSETQLKNVTVDDAIKHPVWSMGKKISVDSATLFNKGLEILEAQVLFNLPIEKISVIIHPQSIVHGMVELIDGSIISQMGKPDMKTAIRYALSYPHRFAEKHHLFDIAQCQKLEFFLPPEKMLSPIKLAKHAGMIGGTLPVIFNASNEVAVQAFLEKKISFLQITKIVKEAMDSIVVMQEPSIDDILDTNELTKKFSWEKVFQFSS